jgi:hypothetical protein
MQTFPSRTGERGAGTRRRPVFRRLMTTKLNDISTMFWPHDYICRIVCFVVVQFFVFRRVDIKKISASAVFHPTDTI